MKYLFNQKTSPDVSRELEKMILPYSISENIGITGLKYICERKTSLVRRFVWILALTSMTIWLSLQFYDSISTYFSYKTAVSKRVVSPEKIKFPAITLCNANPLRARSIYDMENDSYKSPTLYESITEFYRILQPSPAARDKQTDARKQRFLNLLSPYVDRLDPRGLFVSASHQAESFISKCTWKGNKCDHRDFTPTLTDSGMCYTFNKNATLYTQGADADSGLNLVLFLEPWDYIRGPRSAIGALVYIHDQSELPSLISTRGQVIVSGTWTSVSIRETREVNLPPPHGTCGRSQLEKIPPGTPYTTNNCMIDKLTKHIAEICGCVLYYMEKPPNIKYCTFSQVIGCVREKSEESSDTKETASTSGPCILSCHVTNYDVTISQTEFSERYSKILRMDNGGEQNSEWPANPDRNPLFVQSWMFLNEMNPNFTDTIWAITEMMYDILGIGSGAISDISSLLDTLDHKSSLYDDFSNFKATLEYRLFMNVNSKSCNDMSRVKRCMAAELAAEQLMLVQGAIETSNEVFQKLEVFKTDFKLVEDTMAQLVNNENFTLQQEMIIVTSPFPQPNHDTNDTSLKSHELINEKYRTIKEKVGTLLQSLDTLYQAFVPFRDDIEDFWSSFDFSREEIVDTIRNPGPHLLKVDLRLEDMTFTEIKQTEAYPWVSLIGDIGGTMGLCLGGSVLTFVEIVDVIITWFLYKREVEEKGTEGEERNEDGGRPEDVANTAI